MSTTVRGPVIDLDERYERIVIEVRSASSTNGPPNARLVGGYAVCPMEKPYTLAISQNPDALMIGDTIEFEVTG